MTKGWKRESKRHSLAARGVSTSRVAKSSAKMHSAKSYADRYSDKGIKEGDVVMFEGELFKVTSLTFISNPTTMIGGGAPGYYAILYPEDEDVEEPSGWVNIKRVSLKAAESLSKELKKYAVQERGELPRTKTEKKERLLELKSLDRPGELDWTETVRRNIARRELRDKLKARGYSSGRATYLAAKEIPFGKWHKYD
jgi:hypothetical protein